jgi:uncharacterized membrane protein YfcA
VLIALSCALVLIQPRLSRLLSARPADARGPWLWLGTLAAGSSGGYFGAGQGILLIGLMGIMLDEELQRVNAAKNVLALLVNFTAAVLYILVADVDWQAVLLVALGSMIAGFLGAPGPQAARADPARRDRLHRRRRDRQAPGGLISRRVAVGIRRLFPTPER